MKKKVKKSVSLKYNQEKDSAPVVSAVGRGHVADEILEIAKSNNIPIVEDSSLVEILAELQINERIPEQLFEAVAEVFAFVYQIDKKID